MKKQSTLYLVIEIIKKDLRIEARSRANLNQMMIFAITVSFLFSFYLDVEKFFPQIIILILLFTSIAGSTILLKEFDFETIEGLKASPLTSQQIMTAKILSNLIIVLFLSAFVYPICYGIFNLEGNFLLTFGAIIIAIMPISTTITLLTPLSVSSKGREMMLLAMIYPMIFPILMPAMKSISLAYSGTFDLMSILFLITYTGVIYSLSLLLSDHIL